MRIRVLSDLHLEFAGFDPPRVSADVVVLAGDIAEGIAGIAGLAWAREAFDLPIVYVIGNHELYEQRLPDAHEQFAAEADRLGIHLLENKMVVIDGVRFLGATLWTDYSLYAKSEEGVRRFMFAARRGMNDYKYIRYGPKRRKARDRLKPDDVLNMHRASKEWLNREFSRPFTGQTVVISHHAPHERSVPAHFAGDEYTPCYASHLEELVRPPVNLWIHGHIHTSHDYTVAGTRIVSNPRGYRPPHDNPTFDPELVLEI